MRRLAWWARRSLTSAAVWPTRASTARTDSGMRSTAWRKTSRPSIEQEMPAFVDLRVRGARVIARAGRVDPELFGVRAVGVEIEGEDALAVVVGRAEHHGAGAVGEDDGGVATGGRDIHAGGLDLGADDEDVAELARPDPGVRDRERVDEPAALGADVDRGDGADAEPALQEDAVAGREVVGGRGGVDDGVEVAGAEARHLERPFGGAEREVGAGLALAHPVPLLDAGAGADPFVAGVHDLRQVVIRDDAVGHGETGAEKAGATHRGFRGWKAEER